MSEPLYIFPTPDTAHCELRHDTAGWTLTAIPGVHPTGRPGQVFAIPDATPDANGVALTISAPGQLPLHQRGSLRLGSVCSLQMDDFHLNPSGPPNASLTLLHQDGWDLRDAAGVKYTHIQATNYLLFQRFLEGQDIEPLLYDGFDGYNVTFTMSVVPGMVGFRALRPENYPNYFQRVDDFFGWMTARERRLEATLLCDGEQMGLSLDWQRRYTEQMYDVARRHPEHIIQLGNEVEKNGVFWRELPQPAGLCWSRGSSLAGGQCPLPAGTHSMAHLSRNPGGDYLDAQPYYMIKGYDGYRGTQGPTFTNETRGGDERENTDRRTTDPHYFRRIAGASREWGGMTYHSTDGCFSRPLGPVQRACADAFLEGIRG